MKKLFIVASITLTGLFANAQSSKVTVVEACETTTGWSNSPTLDNADFKEGKGSIKSEGVVPFRFKRVWSEPVNTGLGGKPGYIGFWLYVSDNTDFATSPGLLFISSSGKGELNAHQIWLKDQKIEKGWNKIVLPLTETSARGGAFDDTKLNYFVLYQKTTAPAVFKIDNIRFAKDAKDL